MTTADHSLDGARVLVVEDEAMIAMLVEDMLTDLGYVVVDIAGTVAKGLAIAGAMDIELDGAVLDVNLGGEKVFPVAEALAARGVPFVFASGYGKAGMDGKYAGTPVIAKPFSVEMLDRALAAALAGRA